jgi:ATP-binding cassette subfamily A (ABC1) protein 1/ATP-binding cassette subfamily A (ABC1) protein 3
MPALAPYGGASWVAACLLPPSAISLFAHVLVRLETAQRGLTWGTMGEAVTMEYPFR